MPDFHEDPEPTPDCCCVCLHMSLSFSRGEMIPIRRFPKRYSRDASLQERLSLSDASPPERLFAADALMDGSHHIERKRAEAGQVDDVSVMARDQVIGQPAA